MLKRIWVLRFRMSTFGASLRVLGNTIEKPDKFTQTLTGSFPLYSAKNSSNEAYTINGSSGGISIMTNSYGEGYYYEIVALNYLDTENFKLKDSIDANTVVFYKLKKETYTENGTQKYYLKPTLLYSTFQNIIVDSGKFAGKVKGLQDSTQDSIYDLSIKVNKINDKD